MDGNTLWGHCFAHNESTCPVQPCRKKENTHKEIIELEVSTLDTFNLKEFSHIETFCHQIE